MVNGKYLNIEGGDNIKDDDINISGQIVPDGRQPLKPNAYINQHIPFNRAGGKTMPMKLSFMEPFERTVFDEIPINPFRRDMISMGTRVGDGRLYVMYNKRDCSGNVYLVDTLTGERVKIELEEVIKIEIDEHTAIIANMCDGCGHITPSSKGYDVCKLHPNTLTLECTINNLPCPDYTKEVT